MKTLKSLIAISILSMSSSLAVAHTSDTTDIEALTTKWAMSFGQGKTDALMDLYTENAMVFPPSSEILDCPSAISTYLLGLREVGMKQYTISNVDLDIKGDTAYETGLWEVTRIDSNGDTIMLEGNITNVLERQKDGNWKIKLQSWN
jgi:ketosteroid isomerase-like protein